MTSTPATPRAASLNLSDHALVIHNLRLTDPAVVTEAQHWADGRRGPAAEAEVLTDADLEAFVVQAIAVGAQALAYAGGSQHALDLERLVTELGGRAEASAAKAAEATSTAARAAGESVSKSTDNARKAITETLTAGAEAARAGIAKAVEDNTAALRNEIERLLGGENPELAAKLTPVLDGVGRRLGDQAFKQTDELLTKITRQFDPADPTSPFAKQAAVLRDQHELLTRTLTESHQALGAKVDELAKVVEVTKAAAAAAEHTASVTPLKGATYEGRLNAVLTSIAAGLGDEYLDTRDTIGAITRCKKGDGVLVVDGGRGHSVRLVVEAHDAHSRRAWNDYLDEAERNRGAAASLGLVRRMDQNGGHRVRALGPRRLVLAHDPGVDDEGLLRAVIQLLRLSALSAAARRDDEGVHTAREHLGEASTLLASLDGICKQAGSIRTSADGIERASDSLKTRMLRHLTCALDALAGMQEPGNADASAATTIPGVHGAA